ncbi:5-(carboxyamino)imidazole ribonucleotide mutase [Pelagibacteraceae bacterium]|nr:5-(carboxyamino)imidazole ribonucleotide mutase [Pelagibacteraceae bacterium]
MKNKRPTIGVIMGSKSDWEIMKNCCDTIKSFGVNYDVRVISAHRTPKRLEKFIKESEKKGTKVIIAAAGGAAHLAGVTAALTTIPVLGVPIESVLKGIDSLLSTAQMPAGVPVATFAIGKAGAINSALFAIAILSDNYPEINRRLKRYRANFEKKVPKKPF